ncbi:MAG: hypothetical protein ABUS48_05360 [Pseudomonadota bacterium]
MAVSNTGMAEFWLGAPRQAAGLLTNACVKRGQSLLGPIGCRFQVIETQRPGQNQSDRTGGAATIRHGRERGPRDMSLGDLKQSAASLKALLAKAEDAFVAGDVETAERSAKAISALARAHRDVAEVDQLARNEPPEEDEEALRAEIRSRIARFVDADREGAPASVLERLAREAFEG